MLFAHYYLSAANLATLVTAADLNGRQDATRVTVHYDTLASEITAHPPYNN